MAIFKFKTPEGTHTYFSRKKWRNEVETYEKMYGDYMNVRYTSETTAQAFDNRYDQFNEDEDWVTHSMLD